MGAETFCSVDRVVQPMRMLARKQLDTWFGDRLWAGLTLRF